MAIPAKQGFLVHGQYKINKESGEDCYIACVKDIVDGHSEIVYFPRPEVYVYVTKPQFRTNTVKPECIELSKVDAYKTRVSRMGETLFNAINNPGKFRSVPGYINVKKQMSSPYVYGADIDYGVHVKLAYNKANGNNSPKSYNVGSLDIETDVVNQDHSIILITFMNGDGRTFVGVLKDWYQEHTVDEANKLWVKTEKQFHEMLNEKAKAVYEKSEPIQVTFKIFDKELDLIKWIFDMIHECKPDFCTIWNIAYDIPFILDRIAFRGGDAADIICHPDIKKEWRVCEFKEDKGKKDGHITDRWSWFNLTDYTRYIDAMCLYGRLRKAKPKEPSYKLDYIGTKEIGRGKLEFGEGEDHSTMQRFHKVEYTVYNVIDVLILHVMEKKNGDIFNLVMLSGVSTLDCFAHQSVQLKNSYYDYLMKRKWVPTAIGDPITHPWDKYIQNCGGAVLNPTRALGISVPVLKEADVKGFGTRFVCDLDVASMYPNLLATFNVTRQTKLATMLRIDNTKRAGKLIDPEQVVVDPSQIPEGKVLKEIPVDEFCLAALYSESNANIVGKMFGLPNYAEVDEFIRKRHPELAASL